MPKKIKSFEDAVNGNFIDTPRAFKKRPVMILAAKLKADVEIETLEGTMRGDMGSWLIRGVAGEVYACDARIFKATYDIIEVEDVEEDDEVEERSVSSR